MPCTTILIGKKASYDGSTIVARNEDSGNGSFESKRLVAPEDQPRHYRSVISHVQIDLPDNPQRYTAVPNANLSQGIWGEAGFNESQVAMSATETLTTNERVLGADPLVERIPASGAGRGGLPARGRWRHRRGGLPHHRLALHPHGSRGRGSPRRASRALWHVRDERHGLLGRR